jgi:hypothetical protein
MHLVMRMYMLALTSARVLVCHSISSFIQELTAYLCTKFLGCYHVNHSYRICQFRRSNKYFILVKKEIKILYILKFNKVFYVKFFYTSKLKKVFYVKVFIYPNLTKYFM